MPIHEYQAVDLKQSCKHCRSAFENIEKLQQPPLKQCPKCGASLRRLISAPSIGGSKSGFDERAKRAGFHQFKKIGRGEYEKKY